MYKNEWPIFIVAPSPLRLIWKDEILKWIPTIRPDQIQVFKTGKDLWNEEACVFIMTYELARNRAKEIEDRKFKVCIADEAHYLKSRDSKRSKELIPILSSSKRVILISGTPMLARPVEIYNLLKAIRPDIMCSFQDYT